MRTVENGRKDLDEYRWRARVPHRVSLFFAIPLYLSERREMRLRLKDQRLYTDVSYTDYSTWSCSYFESLLFRGPNSGYGFGNLSNILDRYSDTR